MSKKLTKECSKQDGCLVVYDSNDEALICRLTEEKEMLREYFTKGGRSLDEYDRSVVEGTITVRSYVHTSADRTVG